MYNLWGLKITSLCCYNRWIGKAPLFKPSYMSYVIKMTKILHVLMHVSLWGGSFVRDWFQMLWHVVYNMYQMPQCWHLVRVCEATVHSMQYVMLELQGGCVAHHYPPSQTSDQFSYHRSVWMGTFIDNKLRDITRTIYTIYKI